MSIERVWHAQLHFKWHEPSSHCCAHTPGHPLGAVLPAAVYLGRVASRESGRSVAGPVVATLLMVTFRRTAAETRKLLAPLGLGIRTEVHVPGQA